MNEQNLNQSSYQAPLSESATSVQLKKVDPVKRIIAFVIDSVLASVVGFVPFIGAIVGALYMLLRDALPVEALNFKSVGKKLMNLSVVNVAQPEVKIDYATSAKRNWMFALGPLMMFFAFIPILGWIIDIILMLAVFVLVIIETIKIFQDPNGQRMGDKMANTMVIEK
jgi:hypothetical protein